MNQKSEGYRMKKLMATFTPVEITKSNTSFVKVGEKTHISTMQDGTQYLWSDFCQRYERLSWATRLWCVEYKEITK